MNAVILTETHERVGLIRLKRPELFNALNDELMNALAAALDGFEADENIGCVVITGSPKAFAAGADIAAMKDWGYMDVYKS
ncbi:MAG: enoyl-CoA hydratase, partial [Thauera phenolivorans]|nr:enoyl-CoA hydratase [Thauera phenolivorans]